jgi:hypothetical protein
MESIIFMVRMNVIRTIRMILRRAYNMGSPVRSKKMADSEVLDVAAATGLLKPKMIGIGDDRS